MSTLRTQEPVGRLVAERPGRAQVFERWGLDYCCGGKTPLELDCAAKARRTWTRWSEIYERTLRRLRRAKRPTG